MAVHILRRGDSSFEKRRLRGVRFYMLSYTFFNDEEEFTSWFCFFLSFRETTIFCFSTRETMRKKRSSKSLKIFLFFRELCE